MHAEITTVVLVQISDDHNSIQNSHRSKMRKKTHPSSYRTSSSQVNDRFTSVVTSLQVSLSFTDREEEGARFLMSSASDDALQLPHLHLHLHARPSLSSLSRCAVRERVAAGELRATAYVGPSRPGHRCCIALHASRARPSRISDDDGGDGRTSPQERASSRAEERPCSIESPRVPLRDLDSGTCSRRWIDPSIKLKTVTRAASFI